MEPIYPKQKDAMLQNSPLAAPEDILEYERLLARRFAVDPSLPKSPESTKSMEYLESRLRELQAKLFNIPSR